VEGLQQQLATMQEHYQHHRQQHSIPDPSYEAVIAGLRSSMAQVSSMASTVSQENKLLTAENKRLLELRQQQAHEQKQKQVGAQPPPQAQGNGNVMHTHLIHIHLIHASVHAARLLGVQCQGNRVCLQHALASIDMHM
jgi:hypothetical protein